jgi:hypothetical protein
MKKNFFQNPLKVRSPKLALVCMLPLVFVMCRNYEKHVERNRLDNKISQVKQETLLFTKHFPKDTHVREHWFVKFFHSAQVWCPISITNFSQRFA